MSELQQAIALLIAYTSVIFLFGYLTGMVVTR